MCSKEICAKMKVLNHWIFPCCIPYTIEQRANDDDTVPDDKLDFLTVDNLRVLRVD